MLVQKAPEGDKTDQVADGEDVDDPLGLHHEFLQGMDRIKHGQLLSRRDVNSPGARRR